MICVRSYRRAVRRPGFTLIELLVVVAIIALLIAVLLPSLANARRTSQRSACGAQLKAIGSAMVMYSQTFDDYLPWNGRSGNGGPGNSDWTGQVTLITRENWQLGPTLVRALSDYLGGAGAKVYNCPGVGGENPANLRDPATGAKWWNEATFSNASGATARRFRTSYMFFQSDMGNYQKGGSSSPTYYVYDPTLTTSNGGAWWQDFGRTQLFQGFNLYRKKYATLLPSQQLAQDMSVKDMTVGGFVYGNHTAGNAGYSQAQIVGTSNATAQSAFWIVNRPTELSRQNYLYADGSVQALAPVSETTEIFTQNLFTQSLAAPWSVYIGMPLDSDPHR